MVPSTEEELSELFREAIAGITPRLTYKGAERWKPYDRAVSTPTTTRRFRLVWRVGNLQPRGARAGSASEHHATLSVRTDYAGDHPKQQFVIADDFHQVGDTLSGVRAPTNGLVLVVRERTDEVRGSIETDDVVLVDHVYTVRFIRRTQL